jgi:tetratricopeptide (TPR) repeat protein
MRGQSDEALKLYKEAAAQDPLAAAPHFNASQLHLRRFEYADAARELRTASSLDFDLVKTYQSRAGSGTSLFVARARVGPRRLSRS